MEANFVETWAHTKVEVVKLRHTWTISNFSYCTEKNGCKIRSKTFSAGAKDKAKWCLDLYPRGSLSEHKDYVSIFLRLQSSDKAQTEAKAKIAIYNDKMEEIRWSTVRLDRVFDSTQDSWGYYKFLKRSFLFDYANELLPDDKLTILCKITVAGNLVDVPTNGLLLKLKDPVCSLGQNLQILLDTQKFSDVTLVANGRELRAHKMILAARSTVFSAMFEHDMEERKNNRVDIIDMDDTVIEGMLRFIYTGKVPSITQIADSLLVAADKYALDSLKLMCQKPLFESLAIENAAHTLVLADIHGCDWLKTQVVKFIKTHATAVMETEGFKVAVTSHPRLIAEILHAVAIKRNGEVDESTLSAAEKKLSQTHI